MKVIWSHRAENAMHRIERYILAEFGEESRSRFMKEVEHWAYLLEDKPYIGSIEPQHNHTVPSPL